MNSTGRPRTGNDKMMRVRIAPDEWATLEKIARGNKTTVSELVRQGIRALIRELTENAA